VTFRLWPQLAYTLALGIPAAAMTMESQSAATDQTLARYQRAEEVTQEHTRHWLLNSDVVPHWMAGRDQFWYERQTPEGKRFTIFDVSKGTKSDAFDHLRLAQELTKTIDKPIDANDLPIVGVSLNNKDGSISFSALEKSWKFDPVKGLVEDTNPAGKFNKSPDGKLGVFFKDQNLWVRDFVSGKETQITTDGEQYYTYGTPPAASGLSVPAPLLVWSPDSTKIFTAQTDDRKVLDAPVIDFAPMGSVPKDLPNEDLTPKDRFRPKVKPYRVAFPGDENVPTFRLTIIDARNGHQTPVRYQPIPATRMNDTPVDGSRMWWGADSKTAYFVDTERGEKAVHVEAVTADSGSTRELFTETSDTYVELGSQVYTSATIVPLPKSNQLIWYSERSGWAHLYLYDLATGRLVRQLTKGDWLVRDVLGVDESRGQMLISIEGRSKDKNPYYQEIARVDLKTTSMKIVSASPEDHSVVSAGSFAKLIATALGADPTGLRGVAPSWHYFVETVGTAEKPTQTVVRDMEGRLVATVEDADASRLPSYWRWPKVVQLTAADSKTPINALVYYPFDYDPHKKYPIVDCIYGGPQIANVPRQSGDLGFFDGSTYAALGFIAIKLDGRGTIERRRDFHTQSYGHAETASNLEDHIAGIRQLAARDSSIDLARVGITGFSGGGYMTTSALLRYPDFYKVGVAGSGNHDQRIFWNTWGERYEGYPAGDYYKAQANSTYADHLKGRLLLVHGMVDTGVHPSSFFQLEQSLIDANKDFDMLLWPRLGHDIPTYGIRRVWDYFVSNLAGERPPREFPLNADRDIEKEKADALSDAVKAAKKKTEKKAQEESAEKERN